MTTLFETGLINIDNAEAIGSWTGFRHDGGGTPSPGLDNDVQIQDAGCMAIQISSAGTRDEGMYWDFGVGNEVDFTIEANKHFYGWLLITTVSLMNTIENGGAYVIAATDASNWAKFFVGGSDTFEGKWERIVMDITKTPSEISGTFDNTSIQFIGFGMKSSGSAKQDNFFVDRCDYGKGIFQVFSGADGDPEIGWETLRAEDIDNSLNRYGFIEEKSGKLFLSAGIQIGAQGQGGPTTWNDSTGTRVTFRQRLYNDGTSPGLVDAVDYDNLYTITAIGSTDSPGEPTSVNFGTVVGTGDDRQGVQGGSIETENIGVPFTIDFETDIADLSSINLYGISLKFAGITQFSGSSKTNLIGVTWEECGEIQPNDAVVLNSTLIAPQNRGIEMLPTHTMKQLSFIAGADADETEHHIHLPTASDYSLTFDAFNFFGFGGVGSPGNKWHGENSGENADVSISGINQSNANEDEFEITAPGSPTATVTVSNDVSLTVTVIDTDSDPIGTAQTAIYRTSDDAELMNTDTNGSGVATTTFNFISDTPVYIRVRKSSTGTTRYFNASGTGTIEDTGLSATITMRTDTIASS